MRNLFEHIGRTIGLSALIRSGPTVAEHVISPNARRADLRHKPNPARAAERSVLGLLGRMASYLCLLELYGHAPSGAELRACLIKHFASWNQHDAGARKLKKRKRRNSWHEEAYVAPFLWIIAAGRPDAVLASLSCVEKPGWPKGVYFCGDEVFRVGIVVASELPRDRSTLLVRLMAAGPLLADAIADLAELEKGAHERAVADQILLHLRHVLAKKPSRTPEEEEFVVKIYKTWDDARDEGRTEGRNEGRNEGRAEEAARAVLTALRVRGIAVSDVVRERILAQKDPARLERWLERAILAASAAEVIAEPSRAA